MLRFLANIWGIGDSSLKKSSVRLSREDKIIFLDNFGSLISAGIPIIKSLQIIYFQSKNTNVRALSTQFKQAIEQWKNIAHISSNFPNIFSPFDRAMFEMGDATGKIGQALEIITNREEKQLDLERKIRQALIYPISIVFVAIMMVVTIMVYVVPKIEKIYRESHVNLPALTQVIIGISHFLRDNGIKVLLAIGFFIIVFVYALRQPAFRYRVDRFIFSIPIFGNILRKKTLIIFSEFLSTLLEAGILINKSLQIVRIGMGNAYYEAEIDGIIRDIGIGKSLSSALGWEYFEKKMRGENSPEDEQLYSKRIDCFPVELSMAVKIGEQTGSLSRMLEKSASRYNKEVDAAVKNLSSMLEPIVIVVIGGIVWVIIMAIMLPFFNMVNVIH